jgi:tungstate transport system permease protein
MNDFTQAVAAALSLIGSLDSELVSIVLLSLKVSLSASLVALAVGAPLGALLAISRFRGRYAVIVLANAMLGLPPVVVGLGLYLLLFGLIAARKLSTGAVLSGSPSAA